MDQKYEFVIKALNREESFTALCTEYSISTKTGYKWLERFKERGKKGLEELSRKPSSCPLRISAAVVIELVRLKRKHPSWGAKKIQVLYHRLHPDEHMPVYSTVNHIFERAGLVEKRKRRRHFSPERIQNRVIPQAPNDVWTVDFKGWWYTPQREQVNPLTVRDEYSKGILSIKEMEKADIPCVRKEFERLFTAFGLPKCIRSDNGPPFACHFNALGLTKLSVWWMSLGIQLDRIDPGCPYQNGGHERMHLDMAKELEGHLQGSLEERQAIFDLWRNEFNRERPHEALGMKCPSEVYRRSDRPYEPEIEDIEYPRGFYSRRVTNRGIFHYLKKRYFIGNPFSGYTIGMRILEDSTIEIWFACFLIGYMNIEKGLIEYKTTTKMTAIK